MQIITKSELSAKKYISVEFIYIQILALEENELPVSIDLPV